MLSLVSVAQIQSILSVGSYFGLLKQNLLDLLL